MVNINEIAESSNNFLYHYSDSEHHTLLSKMGQHKENIIQLTDTQIKDDKEASKFNQYPPYFNSISLFFDLVPVKSLVGKFPKNHPAWVKGKTLYIHTINPSLITDCTFVVVETETDSIMTDYLWVDNNDSLEKEYFKFRHLLKTTNGCIGTTNKELINIIKKYKGTTKYFFKKWLSNENFSKENHHYAARVPHLMIYPKDSKIETTSIKKIKL